MRLLVVGAGSTGGYFGGRLAEAGRDVTFLVRQARAEQLTAKGLQIVSPHGDVTLAPKVVTADMIAEPFDAILLAVKAYSLDAALKDIAPAVGPETTIVPLLNGLRHLDSIAAAFGRDPWPAASARSQPKSTARGASFISPRFMTSSTAR